MYNSIEESPIVIFANNHIIIVSILGISFEYLRDLVKVIELEKN